MTALITREYKASVTGNGHVFTFRGDGWFNMTKAAQHFGRKLSHFWDSPDTSDYITEVSQLPGFRGIDVFTTSRGRYGGTWAHPKLAVFFARWLDVKFSVWCDAVIEDILKGATSATIKKPQESAVLALAPEYTEALKSLESREYVQANRGRYGGTWAHPKLAVFFAHWPPRGSL